MADLDLNDVQQVERPMMPVPPEEIIRQAGVNIQKVESPQGTITLLQFHTPFKVYTFQLDDSGCEAIAENLNPSPIKRATLADLPR